jgi:esterase/lipase
MKTTILSGFGQNPEILKKLFKGENQISLDYLQAKNFEDLTKRDLKIYDNEIVIGWSLGGQVACRLIEKGILKPKLLILIATPFKLPSDFKFKLFKVLLFLSKKTALSYLIYKSSQGDSNAKEVKEKMKNFSNSKNLINWSNELKFDLNELSFENFPQTLYIAGENDKVVDSSQAYFFKDKIKNIKLNSFEGRGHAPHFSSLQCQIQLLLNIIIVSLK